MAVMAAGAVVRRNRAAARREPGMAAAAAVLAAFALAALVAAAAPAPAAASPAPPRLPLLAASRPHPVAKRSFFDLQCKGVYDKSIFARLDRICEDCYNLFREPQLHSLCRQDCFTSDYFKGCLDVLLLQDEMEKIQTWIKQLHGADPGF